MPDGDETGESPFHHQLDDHVGLVDPRLRLGVGMVVDLDHHHPPVEHLGVGDLEPVDERGRRWWEGGGCGVGGGCRATRGGGAGVTRILCGWDSHRSIRYHYWR